jgi:hypothetical protein
MNSDGYDDELPFVREECGDTMWDETLLNTLTTPQTEQPLPSVERSLETANLKNSGRLSEPQYLRTITELQTDS